jgi:hypothetical protein
MSGDINCLAYFVLDNGNGNCNSLRRKCEVKRLKYEMI